MSLRTETPNLIQISFHCRLRSRPVRRLQCFTDFKIVNQSHFLSDPRVFGWRRGFGLAICRIDSGGGGAINVKKDLFF